MNGFNKTKNNSFQKSKYEIVTQNGITFVKEIENSEYINYDAFLIKDEIAKRYFDIGKKLNDYGVINNFFIYKDDYRPFEKYEIRKFRSFDDFCIKYYNSDEEKYVIDSLILKFVSDFGLTDLGFNKEYFSNEEFLKEMLFYFDYDDDSEVCQMSPACEPIPLIICDICKVYKTINYPEEGCSLNTNISIDLIYNETLGWKVDYGFFGLYELIRYALSMQITNNKSMLKQCSFCGEWFIQTNPKAEYCSPNCRNTSNVRKSRARKNNNG